MRKIYVILTVMAVMTSCMDGFLKEKPEDRYTIDNFYSSQSDGEAAIAAVYQQLYSIYEINETCTNKYHKVFYTTKCGKHCY